MKKLLSLILAAVLLTVATLSFTACGDTALTEYDLAVPSGSCYYTNNRDIEGRDVKYVMITVKDHGSMIVLLDATTAPITVSNFLKLVNRGFYDGLTFHRVMNDFMIQGGCPNGNGTGDAGEDIIGEFALNGKWNDIFHKYGVISMARNGGTGAAYNTASSQFFICNSDSASVKALDMSYAAFGYVIAGLSVVDSVTYYTAGYATDGNGGITDKANQAVIARIIEISAEEAWSYVEK